MREIYVGVGAEPEAGLFDLNHHGIMQEAIQQDRNDDRVAKRFATFGEASVGREHHGCF